MGPRAVVAGAVDLSWVDGLGGRLWRSPITWLVVTLGVVGVRAWRAPSELAWLTGGATVMVGVALLLLWLGLTDVDAGWLLDAVATVALAVIPVLILSRLLEVDLLAGLGGPRVGGALLALAIPVAPLWALPLLAMGLVYSQSYLAIAASAAGLVVMTRSVRIALALAVTLPILVAALWWLREGPMWASRWSLWQLAVPSLLERPWLGCDPGCWGTTMPWLEIARDPARAWHAHAHADVLEWVYEMGLVGLALVVGFVVMAWPAFRASCVRGSLVALAILTVGFQPWHSLVLLPPILVLVAIGLQGRGRARA